MAAFSSYAAVAAVLAAGTQTVVSTQNAAKGRKVTRKGQQDTQDRAKHQEKQNAQAKRNADRNAHNNDISAIVASNKPGNTGIASTNLTGPAGTTTLGGGVA